MKLCYNGNSNIKKSNVMISYTEEQITELIKCKKDIIYFIRNYIYIVSTDDGLVKFNLYPYQEEMIKCCQENSFSIFLLSRQLGKCLSYKTNLKLRNKKTGEIVDVAIGEFFDKIKSLTN
jgi:hypothetical protein